MTRDYLNEKTRKEYLKELNTQQRQVIDKYKRYQFNSKLLTEINQAGTKWELIHEDVFSDYDFHNQAASPLICECGKHVKYLYTCKAKDTGAIKKFGKNHLQQEAGIPKEIISQVNKLHHKIDRGMDVLLSKFHSGERFPKDDYELALKYKLLDKFTKYQKQMLKDFYDADLPLYDRDKEILENLVESQRRQEKANNELLKSLKALQAQYKKPAVKTHVEQPDKLQISADNNAKDESKPQPEPKKTPKEPINTLKAIQDTWKKLFSGHEYWIPTYGIGNYPAQICCYVLLHGKQKGDTLSNVQGLTQEASDFINSHYDVKSKLMAINPFLYGSDPYITSMCHNSAQALFNALLDQHYINFNDSSTNSTVTLIRDI